MWLIFLIAAGLASAFSVANVMKDHSVHKSLNEIAKKANLPDESGLPVSLGPDRDSSKGKLYEDMVVVPCSECAKIIDGYITMCMRSEANDSPLMSLREYCGHSLDKKSGFTENDYSYCQFLGQRLAMYTGTNFAALHTNNHRKGSCAAFSEACDHYGGGPSCYSGFCDDIVGCIDCPSISLISEEGESSLEVCGDRGVCKIVKDSSSTGYCDCDDGFRGVACESVF